MQKKGFCDHLIERMIVKLGIQKHKLKRLGCTHYQLHFNTRQANLHYISYQGDTPLLDEFMLKPTINEFCSIFYFKACKRNNIWIICCLKQQFCTKILAIIISNKQKMQNILLCYISAQFYTDLIETKR